MAKNVLLIGTLDTKGAEIAYLRDQLQALGLTTIVVDSGILGEPLGITGAMPVSRSCYAGMAADARRLGMLPDACRR